MLQILEIRIETIVFLSAAIESLGIWHGIARARGVESLDDLSLVTFGHLLALEHLVVARLVRLGRPQVVQVRFIHMTVKEVELGLFGINYGFEVGHLESD